MSATTSLTWREQTAIRILLFVARIVAADGELAKEIQALANHIAFGDRKT